MPPFSLQRYNTLGAKCCIFALEIKRTADGIRSNNYPCAHIISFAPTLSARLLVNLLLINTSKRRAEKGDFRKSR